MNEKEDMVRVRDKHDDTCEEDIIVDVKRGVILCGKQEVLCSRNLSRACSLLCPLVCHDDDEITFYCGCQAVTYECEVKE